MSRVELVEEGTAGTPNFDFALSFVVFWPSPHLSYPGEPGVSRTSASRAIQTSGFVLPHSPAPAPSSRSDPPRFQDFTLTDPHHPARPTYS